mgnify:CR=1 FL=1
MTESTSLNVIKRDGSKELVSFDKVTNRLRTLSDMSPKLKHVNFLEISQKVVSRIYDNVHTYELDELASQQCVQKSVQHIEYNTLASRIVLSNNHKQTSPSFSETMTILKNNTDQNGNNCSLIDSELYNYIMKNKSKINAKIDYSRDYNFDYFAFKTLEKAYLTRVNNVVIERIQDMIMRVALGIHKGSSLKYALDTYDLMSNKYFTHATPTLFHSGTPRPQLLSCFLLGIDDSVKGMYKALSDCAEISKWAGGIGCHIHDIRSCNSVIRSTNGISNGIVPMLKVFNECARHINQSGKRNGSFAMYLEVWHADILSFLECKKNHGDENARARDLFYGVWVCNLFMDRVKNDEEWSLFCPDSCKNLTNFYGEEFNKLYIEYEKDSTKVIKKVRAQTIWREILCSQMETGTPYICYKDHCNLKSNQKNIGTIKSSNLCTEIIEYSDSNEYACCTLASISLPAFIENFNFNKVEKIKIYSKSECKYCKYAKKLLDSYNLPFQEINLDDDVKRRDFFIKLNRDKNTKDINTVPQIFINNEYVGGFSELYKYFLPTFNYKKLMEITSVLTNNLNKIIDINFYPVIETKLSNMKHRPLGIGVQGLADVYALFKCSFDSDLAKQLNKNIFACIYYSACKASMKIAKERNYDMIELKKLLKSSDIPELYDNNKYQHSNTRISKLYHILKPNKYELQMTDYHGSYSSFINSPIQEGKFQFDLWNVEPIYDISNNINLNWDELRSDIKLHGMRNSLLIAPMPTASTSQILGNNECIEPFTSNIYSRSTLAGQFLIINKYLQNDLLKIGLWNDDLKDKIILNNGSVQQLNIPSCIKEVYKISWELSMRTLIDQAADRGAYVCQSQSLNLWVKNPDINTLSSMHMYSYEKGLKTGIYYLRRRSIVQAQSFSIDPEKEECLMCSA